MIAKYYLLNINIPFTAKILRTEDFAFQAYKLRLSSDDDKRQHYIK